MLVSFDKETQSFGGLIDLFKAIPDVTAETMDSFSTMDVGILNTTNTLRAYCNELGIVDERLINWLETQRASGVTFDSIEDAMSQYTTKLKSTSIQTKLATIKTTALSAAMKVLSAAMWGVGIALAANVISGIVKVIDSLRTSTSELEESLDELTNKLDEENQKIKEIDSDIASLTKDIRALQDKGTLSFVEQEELDRLKETVKELGLARDAAEIVKEATAKQISEDNEELFNKKYKNQTINLQNYENDKYYYKEDVSNSGSSNILEKGLLDSNGNVKNISELLSRYKFVNEEISDILENGIPGLQADEIKATVDEYESTKTSLELMIGNMIKSISDMKSDAIAAGDIDSDYYKSLDVLLKDIYTNYNSSSWNSNKFEEIFNSKGIETTQEELIKLSKAGKLTEESLREGFPYLTKAITEADFALTGTETNMDLFIQQIQALANSTKTTWASVSNTFSRGDMIDDVTKMSDAFSALDDIMADVKDGDTFDFSKLTKDKFSETFSGLEEEYEEFIEVVAANSGDMDKCLPAFNNLITAYIRQSGILKNVNESNKDVTLSMLELYGITNAQELINYELSKSESELILQEEGLVDETGKLVNKTGEEIEAFINAAKASDSLSTSLAMTLLQKIAFSNSRIDTSEEVENMLALASAAGFTSNALLQIDKHMEALENETDPQKRKWIQRTIDEYNNQLKNDIATWTPTVDYGGGDKTNQSSSKDPWLDKYKEEMSILEDNLSRELITQRQFYDESEKLLYKYLKDTPAHMEKYAEEISNANKSQHDNWISAYEEQKEALDNALGDGKINAATYAEELEKLVKEYYILTDATNEYGKYTKELEQAQRDLAQAQKDAMDSAISAIVMLHDKQIEKYEEAKEAFEKANQEKVDALEEEIKAYEKQVDSLDDLIEKKEKEIEALEDANEERENALRLQKAQEALDSALNSRTKAKIIGGVITYVQDESAIKDAKEELENTRHEMAVKELEAQKELLESNKEAIEKQIKLLEKQKEVIEDAIEKSNKQFEKLTDALTKSKDKWSDLADISENASMLDNLKTVLGEMGLEIDDLYSMSDETFTTFKKKYIEHLASMNDKNEQFNESMNEIAAFDSSKTVDNIAQIRKALQETDEATKDVSKSLTGGSDESEDGKKKDEESESGSLTGAIENVKNVANESIPTVKQNIDSLGDSVGNTTEKVNALAEAFEKVAIQKSKVQTSLSHGKITASAYASGAKRIKEEEWAWTQEQGQEIIVSPTRKAVYTALQPGDSVLTSAMTDNMWKWAKLDPDVAMHSVRSMSNISNTPTVSTTNITPTEQHFSFNISMPNVTDNTAAERIANDLKSIAVQKFQFFNKR